jgi:hypothetical protein
VFAKERQTPYANLSIAAQGLVQETLVSLSALILEPSNGGRSSPKQPAALGNITPYFADLTDDSMDCARRANGLHWLLARGEDAGNFCLQASLLLCKEHNIEVRSRLLQALHHSDNYKMLVQALHTAKDHCEVTFSGLLVAFVGLQGAEALRLSQWTQPLQNNLTAEDACQMLCELRDLPAHQQSEFVELYHSVLDEMAFILPWGSSYRLKLISALRRCSDRQELAAALCKILSYCDVNLEELLNVLEDLSGSEALSLSGWSAPLYRAIDDDNVPQLLGKLLNLSVAEQLPFVEACQPLIACTNNRDYLADMLVGLTDTIPERRLSTVRMLLQSRATNNENVMLASRNKHTHDAILTLRKYFPAPLNTAEILAQLSGFLERVRSKEPTPEVFLRKRAGASELDNALWVLQGDRDPFTDHTSCLQSNSEVNLMGLPVRLGELCAQVWHAISQYQAAPSATLRRSHRRSMRHSMVLALAQCREDDGHRVCGVGVSQRLLTVLQGYYPGIHVDRPEPQTLLCDAAKEFMAARLRPESDCSAAEVDEFKATALHSARRYFGLNSEEMVLFVNQLDDYAQTL